VTGTRQFWVVITVALGVLMNPINTTMISVAFSRIQEQFDVGFNEISWLIASYYIISAIAQPMMGKLNDLWGSKKIFIWGLLIVTVSSMLAPLSPSMGWLMVFRGVQAIGTSALHPAGMSMLRYHVTEKQAKALGTVSVFSAASAALGPSVGGFLIHYNDWQAIFLVNFPIIVIAFFLVLFVIPRDLPNLPHAANGGRAVSKPLVYPVHKDRNAFYHGAINWIASMGSLNFLRSNVSVCLVYAQYILVNIVLYSILFSFPTYLQSVRQLDAEQVGIVMLALSAPNLFIIPFIARWVDNNHSTRPMIISAIAFMVSVLLILFLNDLSPILLICVVLAILGISNGVQNLTLQTVLYQVVPREATGISTGLFQTSRFIGTILSTALLGLLFGSQVSTLGLHLIALSCAAMCVGIIIFSLGLRSKKA
jgi:MFS family permease